MLTKELKLFAEGNLDFYVAFEEYYACKNDSTRIPSVPMAEMAEKIKSGFLAEVERKSGFTRADNKDAWMANPSVQWASMAILNQIINSLMPKYITNSLAPFVDMRFVERGTVVKFKVRPRALYTISRGAHGERETFRQKSYSSDVIVTPIEHIVTVYVDMFSVLAGDEDIAEFIRQALLSIERDMRADAIQALNTGLSVAANYPTQFIEEGAFNTQTAIQLAQRVQAYNYGAKPVIMGTAAALSMVLPDYSAGFRMNVEGKDGVATFVKNFYGFDLYEIEQIPSGKNYGMLLDDNVLYFVSPSVDKVIKGVGVTTMTNSNQFFDNADLTSDTTIRRDWDFVWASAGFAGKYTITQ